MDPVIVAAIIGLVGAVLGVVAVVLPHILNRKNNGSKSNSRVKNARLLHRKDGDVLEIDGKSLNLGKPVIEGRVRPDETFEEASSRLIKEHEKK